MPLLNEEKSEEEKSRAMRWYQVRNRVKEQFGERPDINALLFIIGMNEVGIVKEKWEKEEKQDLMHVAICKLMSSEGYYELLGNDDEGWPIYEPVKNVPKLPLKEQDELLKRKIIEYFEAL
jgi:hypothetical protein